MLNIAAKMSSFFVGGKGFFITHVHQNFGGCRATHAEIAQQSVCETWGPVAIETLHITGKICVGRTERKRLHLGHYKYSESLVRKNMCP